MLSWQEADCAPPLGKVIEVLGFKDDPGVDILSIVRKHQLPEFSRKGFKSCSSITVFS